MNKEVNYVLQGFLLTVVVIGAFKFSDLLLSIPPPPPEASPTAYYNNDNRDAYMANHGTDGKALFQSNCASCHSVFKDMTGPALSGISRRLPDRKLAHKWVRNPAGVLKSGDVYFNTLKKKFNDVQMTPFPDLSDAEIDAILDYVEARSKPTGY